VRTPVVELADWRGRLQQVQSALETEQRGSEDDDHALEKPGRPGSSEGQPLGPSQGPCRAARSGNGVFGWNGALPMSTRCRRTAEEVYFLIHEALVNAARHSGASVLRLEVALGDGRVAIVVADNGHGFPFKGGTTS